MNLQHRTERNDFSVPPRLPVSDSLHVETVGAGAPLVLLHGWAMHGGLWQSIVPQLAQSHRVHVVDLPGHGHSAPVEPYTLEAIAVALDAHFAAEPEPLTLLGWSFGGLVAMRWALKQPQRIARLALLCTSPHFVRTHDWPHAMDGETLARFGDELRVNYRATLLRFLSLQVKDSEQGKASLASLRARLFERGEPAPELLQRGLRVLAETDLRGEVAGLTQPALVIAGDRDMLTPWRAGRWLADVLPDARYGLIEGAAHAPFLSHADQFLSTLTPFLDS
jgi:pimeloyl-[acyl-carrier protein] methyl ester esterase